MTLPFAKVYKEGKKDQEKGTPLATFKLIEDVVTNYPSQFLHTDVQDRAKRLADYAVEISIYEEAIRLIASFF